MDELLRDRLLIMVNDQLAIDMLPHVPARTGGLVLTGAAAPVRCREIRNVLPKTVVAMDYCSHTQQTATADAPFCIKTPYGWRRLDLAGLSEILDGQRDNKASYAVTPTCFIPADQVGDASVLKAVIRQANQLRRDDTLLLLPCSWRWFQRSALPHLAEQIQTSRHPVALIVQADGDPLERKQVPEGLRQLCRSCPRLVLWRTDLAAFDAMAHGALGAAVGASAVLRHGVMPRPDSAGGGHKPYPVVLVRRLLRYHRVATLDDWFAHVDPWTCTCAVCDGAALTRFTDSDADVLAALQHTVRELYSLHEELEATLPGDERIGWWRQQLADAWDYHRLLASQTDTEVSFPKVLQAWRRPSPPALPAAEAYRAQGQVDPS
ncbi:hypothetical protein [Streptomyces panaciradicis]|uniref:hypothetical protein n=1 Tax=Streptomyces panaciradicis TaxID=1470261 RepID=UPI00201CBEF8|nr:hypothetical protein [Streptomyces panaciradicis]MCL6669598.1 hypothetical protein [Streptomyces panaciradicis]